MSNSSLNNGATCKNANNNWFSNIFIYWLSTCLVVPLPQLSTEVEIQKRKMGPAWVSIGGGGRADSVLIHLYVSCVAKTSQAVSGNWNKVEETLTLWNINIVFLISSFCFSFFHLYFLPVGGLGLGFVHALSEHPQFAIFVCPSLPLWISSSFFFLSFFFFV